MRRSLGARSPHAGSEDARLERLFFSLVLGLGFLFIGIAVADGIGMLLTPYLRTFREIHKMEQRRAARPILLAEWNVPRA